MYLQTEEKEKRLIEEKLFLFLFFFFSRQLLSLMLTLLGLPVDMIALGSILYQTDIALLEVFWKDSIFPRV